MYTFTQRHPIPIIDISDFDGDITRFYAEYAHMPVIIKGVFADNEFFRDLTPSRVEALLKGQPLWAYERITQPGAYILADEIFANYRNGGVRYNVVDHPIGETPFALHFEYPSFLAHNWFIDSGFKTDWFPACVISTGSGNFSPIHTDPYGEQGWMYLVYGCKEWEFFHPRYIPLLFDVTYKTFFNTRDDVPEKFPFAHLAECYYGTMEGGDMLVFPPGWPHQVFTSKDSFGIGGAVVNDFLIDRQMRCWLWERSLWGNTSLDFKAFVTELGASRTFDAAGAQRTQAALQLCAEWEATVQPREK